jgi:hypothetical protein
MLARTEILFVHDAGGTVWYSKDDRKPIDSKLPASDFISTAVVAGAERIRTVGGACNAKLISCIYEVHQKAGLLDDRVMELCSPAFCRTDQPPVEVLDNLWYTTMRSRPGLRWHRFTVKDYCAYALTASVYASDRVPCKARQLLLYHPAWLALSFVPNISLDKACLLLALIGDPRWFYNPHRPNRLTRLHRYLGLTRMNMLRLVGGRHEPDIHYNNALCAVETWCHKSTMSTTDTTNPRHFLSRIARISDEPVKGFLMTTRIFVNFLARVWLDQRDPERHLFSPQAFFRTDSETAAFVRHRERMTWRNSGVDAAAVAR